MAQAVSAAPAEAPAASRAWSGKQIVVLLVIGVGALMVSLTQSLLVPVLGELAVDLNASQDGIAWLLTSTLLVGAVAVPAFGRLGDLYGTRLLVLVALVSLVVGSLICALSDSLPMMIVGRSVVGLSVATVPLSISLIGVILPKEHAGAGIALISAMLGVGGALGLPLAGVIAQYADYHVLFWICVAGGIVAIPGILLLVPSPKPAASGRMDIPGTVLLGAAMLALLLPLAQGESWGWTSPLTLGLLAAAAVLLVAFVLIELRITSPLVDVRTTARPALLLTNIASLFVGFALFATLIGTATYVQAPEATGYGFGKSILVGGLCMLPGGLAMLVLSPFSASGRSGHPDGSLLGRGGGIRRGHRGGRDAGALFQWRSRGAGLAARAAGDRAEGRASGQPAPDHQVRAVGGGPRADRRAAHRRGTRSQGRRRAAGLGR